MRPSVRLLCAAVASALVLASTVSAASAGHLSTSSQTFRQVWTPLTFIAELNGSIVAIRCNVTLEGSFHSRTIVKQAEALVGYVTKAQVAHPCSGGEMWSLNGIETTLGSTAGNTLPWHLTYEAFDGTLPNISGVRMSIRPRFIVNFIGVLCLYEGSFQGTWQLSRGTVLQIQPDGMVTSTKRSGGIFCGPEGFFSLEAGAGSIATVLGSATQITITLI